MRKFSQMAAAAMGMAKGSSADRPNNPAVGDQFVNGTLGITEVYTENDGWQPLTSSSTGIPFGGTADRPNNDLGQPFFNGEESRLELFTSATGWQNIVQETPGVVSVVGNYIEGNPSTALTINGSNFASGAIASVVGQDGTEIIADTTQLVSVAEITATFSGLSANNEPYDVKVTNPSNLSGTAFEILQVDDIPVFITQSGSLGTYIEESPMSVQISATDEEDSPLVFSVSSGSLPAGLSLNTATGEISGTPTDLIPNTTSTFEISATDGANTATRSFSITINDRGPTWQTAETLPTFSKNIAYSQTLVANDDNGIASYSLVSGSFPSGISLNSSTGLISGTALSDLDSVFTIRATDNGGNYSDRQFILNNSSPTINSGIRVYSGDSLDLSGVDDSSLSYEIISGSLPPWATFNSSTGLLSGIPSGEQDGNQHVFTIRATDANQRFSEGEVTLVVNFAPVWNTPSSISSGLDLNLQLFADGQVSSTDITYSLSGGSLPSGGSLSSSGLLSGSQMPIGTYSFTVTAEDNQGLSSDRSFSLSVTESYNVSFSTSSNVTWSSSGRNSASYYTNNQFQVAYGNTPTYGGGSGSNDLIVAAWADGSYNDRTLAPLTTIFNNRNDSFYPYGNNWESVWWTSNQSQSDDDILVVEFSSPVKLESFEFGNPEDNYNNDSASVIYVRGISEASGNNIVSTIGLVSSNTDLGSSGMHEISSFADKYFKSFVVYKSAPTWDRTEKIIFNVTPQ